MNISDAAKKSELPVKTIRYYADIGLVKETGRTATGYRTYDETAIKRLIFVRRSREFGFSISQTEELLTLYSDEKRSSAEVKAISAKTVARNRNKTKGIGDTQKRALQPRTIMSRR